MVQMRHVHCPVSLEDGFNVPNGVDFFLVAVLVVAGFFLVTSDNEPVCQRVTGLRT